MNSPVAAPTHEMWLHPKVLSPPAAMTPEDMIDHVRTTYAPCGIRVCATPVQTLGLDVRQVLQDLRVGECWMNNPTEQQKTLFACGDDVPPDELCIYFVRSIIYTLAGCSSCASAAGYVDGRAVAVISAACATGWTLAHECGHLLGLDDVVIDTQVMFSMPALITASPPLLDSTEDVTVMGSRLVRPVASGAPPPGCAPPPPPPPQPTPPSAMFAAAELRADAVGDPAADDIRRELSKDDGIHYAGLARRLGPSAVEALVELLNDGGSRIAAGAVCLGALLKGGAGLPAVEKGSTHEDPVVRVAAAAVADRLPREAATPIVRRLLDDRDVGVRVHAVRSAVHLGSPELRELVEIIARDDPSEALQELAARLLERRPDGPG
jgi:hypothetical protein